MNIPDIKKLLQINLGRIKYNQAWDIQKELVALRYNNTIQDCLIVCEHDPVLTMGRGTDMDNLLVSEEILKQKGVDLFEIERGGDITFHGPGQVILYPIISLHERSKDAHKYLRDLETAVIKALSEIGLEASIKKGLTGIWINDKKIGAIGVALSKWITYHGMALNVNTDLDFFKLINPCGITEYPVSSISELLSRTIDLETINNLLVDNFVKHFEYDEIISTTIEEVLDKKN